MRTRTAIAAIATLLTLTACSNDADQDGTENTPSTTQESETTTEAPRPTPTPTPEPLPTHLLGEEIAMSNAKITIHSVETVEEIETDEYSENLVPADGESLHLITWEWTNLANEAGWGVCFGPMDTYLRIYDFEDRELALHPDSVTVLGNECNTDVLTGQGGMVYEAYRGLEGAEIAYITLENLNTGASEIVVTDPSIEMVGK